MVEKIHILVLMSFLTFIECRMDPFVVGGIPANITHFPHSVFMFVSCYEAHSDRSVKWVCGGSIVNELIVLTAAHCIYGCSRGSIITVSVGHVNKYKGFKTNARTYWLHEDYHISTVSKDIALVKVKTRLKFGKNVKRIALMKNPPYNEKAQLAGWGLSDELSNKMSHHLLSVQQHVWKAVACKKVLYTVPKGALCAGSGDSSVFPSRGDSGSALIVRGFIQIGIVSYSISSISKSLVVYTDTGYFYNWITKNSIKLSCE